MNYHVYGIGNALVDMEFSVDDGYLRSQAALHADSVAGRDRRG